MSRKIDNLPEPAGRRPMKLIVASPSRSGTLGLYRALQILGFKPYHMYECVIEKGVSHIEVLHEAVIAQHNRLSGITRYSRDDFDKWFAEYDTLVEIPSFLGTAVFEAYEKDPDVKFILTEREPEKWVASINNTAGPIVKQAKSFPLNILKYFDNGLYQFITQTETTYAVLSDRTYPNGPRNEAALRRNYTEYISMVKKVIPADRLCVIKVEEGLGWEQICPFLGVPTPSQEYPDRNEPARFQAIAEGVMTPMFARALIKLATVSIPIVGVMAWVVMKQGSSLSRIIARNL
ncbi:hypothetical protein BDV26DRAFT_271010 [Aspergillus bertholletiae]|uniref:P-loop containing nucleoside triphosphate hydrolase protein n=1 Tax=Aspergillus bertholletiae TaxID=1226010 RepID=A0A5N7AYF7_9EURO|nr:hypothetical protein BDV26DRAFT_271010 [Aspergillus bertholletiae]